MELAQEQVKQDDDDVNVDELYDIHDTSGVILPASTNIGLEMTEKGNLTASIELQVDGLQGMD